jgi:hypothetical protein
VVAGDLYDQDASVLELKVIRYVSSDFFILNKKCKKQRKTEQKTEKRKTRKKGKVRERKKREK